MKVRFNYFFIYLVVSLFIALCISGAAGMTEPVAAGPGTTLSHTNDLLDSFGGCNESFVETRSVGVLSRESWSAVVTTGTPWLQLVAPIAGSGDGFVQYTVERNLTPFSRAGIINIGGHDFSVTQNAFDESAPCPTDVDRSQLRMSSEGGASEFRLNDWGLERVWRAESANPEWMRFDRTQGSGSGTVKLFIKSNASDSSRMGIVVIAGRIIPVIQQGHSGER